jgi:class 3 adenylate cyclase/pimeloyl-ACP methyl ester carboxylesterase
MSILGGVQPRTGYARLGDDRIAYQIIGEGAADLVLGPGTFGSMDAEWEEPEWALFYRRWAQFSRLIRYDPLGSGSSDPVSLDALPPWESSAAETLAVMDAAGSERATILGFLNGGPPAMLFATTKPERTAGLILYHTAARHVRADDYPFGLGPDMVSALIAQIVEAWGTEAATYGFFPSRASDPRFRRWYAKHSRSAASPRAVASYMAEMFRSDARSILPAIHVPTLILHRTDYAFVPIEHARYLAEQIEGAKLIELPGRDAVPIWEDPDGFLEAVQAFISEVNPRQRSEPRADRVMATVLFTDIVASTQQAGAIGDRQWKDRLDLHDELSRRRVHEHGGRLIETTGDGILATFDGPGRAIGCALELCRDLERVGLPIRSGVHAGEVEIRANGIGGITVHIAARVLDKAERGEVLVSRTVRDLVVGSNIAFDDRGTHVLKGIDGEWKLFAVVDA